MLVRISPALEFGAVLKDILRKESQHQTLSITWILMLLPVKMLNNYLMTKYFNLHKINFHSNFFFIFCFK